MFEFYAAPRAAAFIATLFLVAEFIVARKAELLRAIYDTDIAIA